MSHPPPAARRVAEVTFMWRKSISPRLLGFLLAAPASALLFAWVAPNSSEYGILFMEPPVVAGFLVAACVLVLVAAIPWRRTSRPRGVRRAVCLGVLAGVVITEYVYPPQRRTAAVSPEVVAQAQALCDRWAGSPPWASRLAEAKAQRCVASIPPSGKGYFSWRPERWSAYLQFDYANGASGAVMLWVSRSGEYWTHRVTLYAPPTLPPEWVGGTAAGVSAAAPWSWVGGAADGWRVVPMDDCSSVSACKQRGLQLRVTGSTGAPNFLFDAQEGSLGYKEDYRFKGAWEGNEALVPRWGSGRFAH